MKYEREILGKEIIAIHLRGGDYKHFKSIYDVLDESYFKNNLKKLQDTSPKAKVYIFTDDTDDLSDFLKFINVQEYILVKVEQETQPGEILRLMSICKFLISSNSTFSWWAGYLGLLNGTIYKFIQPKIYVKGQSQHDLHINDPRVIIG